MNLINKIKRGYSRVFSASAVNAIFIYQMGKVGSSTLDDSIPGAVHLHTLYGNPPCKVLIDLERRGLWRGVGFLYDLLRRLAIRLRSEIRIITVIRDPVQRNVSMFFQDFPYWYVEYARHNRSAYRSSDASLVESIYASVFPHEYVDEWFDLEIKRLTGIDVYAYPYDKYKGFNLYINGKYKLLLLEMRLIERNWSILEEFVGAKLNLVKSNVGEDKWYGPIYSKHKADLLANDQINQRVRRGKFFKKFYEN